MNALDFQWNATYMACTHYLSLTDGRRRGKQKQKRHGAEKGKREAWQQLVSALCDWWEPFEMLCILIFLYICTYGISAHRPLPHVHFYCYLPIKIIIYILIRNAVPPTTSSGRVHCACFAFQSVCVLATLYAMLEDRCCFPVYRASQLLSAIKCKTCRAAFCFVPIWSIYARNAIIFYNIIRNKYQVYLFFMGDFFKK